mmetsp:Transcript_45735/g.90651  ORF Transcript_45735/g.90651 Transcript_45735/m.90651 type:complete len:205 (-) Transcript_45735:65-679(-)
MECDRLPVVAHAHVVRRYKEVVTMSHLHAEQIQAPSDPTVFACKCGVLVALRMAVRSKIPHGAMAEDLQRAQHHLVDGPHVERPETVLVLELCYQPLRVPDCIRVNFDGPAARLPLGVVQHLVPSADEHGRVRPRAPKAHRRLQRAHVCGRHGVHRPVAEHGVLGAGENSDVMIELLPRQFRLGPGAKRDHPTEEHVILRSRHP